MDCNINIEMLPPIEEITDKPASRCPVDWALNIADTARMNNCGKSVMCRDGVQQLYSIILDITTEKGQSEDIELIQDICAVVKQSEGCDLAKRSAELINESIDGHMDEWLGHIRRKRCNAQVCKGYSSAPVLQDSSDGMRRRKRKSSGSEE